MKKLFLLSTTLLLLFFCCAAQSVVNSKVEYLGTYSNLTNSESDDPHFEGYSLDLFREGNLVFGQFSAASGIEVPGEPIEAVQLNLSKQQLSFRVRMSLSCVGSPGGYPSHDLIEFNGKITRDAVSGTLLLKDGYNPDLPGESEFVTLKRSDVTGMLKTINSYAQWESWNQPLSDDWQPQNREPFRCS